MSLEALGDAAWRAFEAFRSAALKGLGRDVVGPWAGWYWPVTLSATGEIPFVSSGFSWRGLGPNAGRSRRTGRDHGGVDIMYPNGRRRVPDEPLVTKTAHFYADQIGVCIGPGVVAKTSGYVTDSKGRSGYSLVIDHSMVPGFGPLASYVTHCDRLLVEPGEPVLGGQPGYIVGTTRTTVTHAHLELWKTDLGKRGDWKIDPGPFLDKFAFAKHGGNGLGRGPLLRVAGIPSSPTKESQARDRRAAGGGGDGEGSSAFAELVLAVGPKLIGG